MQALTRHLALLLLAGLTLCLGAIPGSAQTVEASFEEGVEAYRRGDYETARTLWMELADEPLARGDRGTLYYDLGNAAFRTGRTTEAVAWYTSSVGWRPRDADAWTNLEFARRAANLPPADRGDLRSTVARLATSLDRNEAAWLVVGSLVLLLGAFVGEALRGGTTWRRLSILALLLSLLSTGPLVWQSLNQPTAPHMVLEEPGASLRSEPRDDSPAVSQASTAEVVEKIDELPGWIRVQTDGGDRGWVPEDAVLALRLPR